LGFRIFLKRYLETFLCAVDISYAIMVADSFLIASLLPMLVLALVLRPHAAQVPSVAPSRAPSSAAPVKGAPSAPPTPSPTLPWARGAGNDGYGMGHAALPTQIGLQYNASSWYFTTGGPIYSSPQLFVNQSANGDCVVVVGSDDGAVYAADALSGALLWRFTTGAMVRGSFNFSSAGGNATVYFGSNDFNVYAVDVATGAQRWSFATAGYVTSTPQVVYADAHG